MTSKPHIQLEALHALARALAAGEFRARTVLERACAVVAEGFGFERVGIVRYIPATGVLIPFAAHGLTPGELETLPAALPIGRSRAFQQALASGTALFVPEPGEEDVLPTPVAREFTIGSFVLVPLMSEGRCLGFMTCDERGEGFWLEPAEIELLGTFGALIAAFLERAIQHAELRRLNELKSQFTALASHELRTPAAAIYGAVETREEAKKCAALFRENRDKIDGIIVTLPNFGEERGIAEAIRLSELNVPILIQATPDTPGRMTIKDRRDSFCGKMSICNNLTQYNIPYSLTTLWRGCFCPPLGLTWGI
jgi:signal transduction histidine kinase